MDGATQAFQVAINSGHPLAAPMAAFNLGHLLAGLDPPDVDGATQAFRVAIDSGHPEWAPKASDELGSLLGGEPGG